MTLAPAAGRVSESQPRAPLCPSHCLLLGPLLLAACADPGAGLQCGQASTPIHQIQGRAAASGLRGQIHEVEGVATLRLSAAEGGALGTFLQAAPDEEDEDRRTAEGLFAAGGEFEPGRRYRVRGRVIEFGGGDAGMTALEVAAARDCGAAQLPPAARPGLPMDRHIEALEGMLATLDGPLIVTGTDRLGSHAELIVAAGTRLYQPTEIAAPGEPARRLQRANLRRSLTLDDASLARDSGAVAWWREPLRAEDMIRAGDTLAAVTGVLGDLDGYRLHLAEPVARVARRARPAPPPRVGNLRVTAFNVLNYFNGDGRGGGFPTVRGAADEGEFERQRAKIVGALGAIDADLLLLCELENDGSGPASAVIGLAAVLARQARRDYRALPIPAGGLGDDAIAVGMIYDDAVLAPEGNAATTLAPPFDDLNRPPLLARFVHRATGMPFAAVAVHLKSKRCGEPDPANRDRGDGQACWNAKRVEAAAALAGWIGTQPGVDPYATLVAGDFNAYSREDPLRELTSRDYRRLLNPNRHDYSFVYRGRAGLLDHAFAGATLADRLARAMVWHVNADEAAWLDYRRAGKPPGDPLFEPSPYRSSDHDPLILDFELR